MFVEEQIWYYSTRKWSEKRFIHFPKGISPKVNVIVGLEFELAHYIVTGQHISHNATRTPSFDGTHICIR